MAIKIPFKASGRPNWRPDAFLGILWGVLRVGSFNLVDSAVAGGAEGGCGI